MSEATKVAPGTSSRESVETIQNYTDNQVEAMVYPDGPQSGLVHVIIPARHVDQHTGEIDPGRGIMPLRFVEQIKAMPSLAPLFEETKLRVGEVTLPANRVLGLGRFYNPPAPKPYTAMGRELRISDYSSHVRGAA
jgi:hypothetical protein